mmetsp:Transcript_7808/g.11090  ORF Transcript_7808/g.11090 Transcript_7808/m.11090 type:complete len:430 (+) Transcript_7808:57-1346(+)
MKAPEDGTDVGEGDAEEYGAEISQIIIPSVFEAGGEEEGKKKKKKKKRSTRKTTTVDFLPEPTDEEQREHHGSRSAGNVKLAKEEAAKKKRMKKEADAGYRKALDKAEAKSFIMPTTEEEMDDFEYEDKFDVQLQTALKRARESGVKGRTRTKDKKDKLAQIAEEALSIPKDELTVKPEDEKKSENIILSATSEFCRGLEVQKEKEKVSKMDVHDENMISVKPSKQAEDTDVKMEMDDDSEEDENEMEEGEASDDDHVDFLHDEPLASGGVAAVLSLAKRRGMLSDPTEKEKTNDPAPNLNLEYPDEYGRPMTAKEAFRKLSHSFHGKAPGKSKQEKKMKKYLEEIKSKKIGNVDDPTHTISKLKQQQKASGKAFLVLDQKLSTEDREKLVKEAQKLRKRQRKKQKKKERAAAAAAKKKARSDYNSSNA